VIHVVQRAQAMRSAKDPRERIDSQALSRDEAPCRGIVSEHNVDAWPNAGLTPLPGRPGVFHYGFVPPRLLARVKAEFLEPGEQGRGAGVRR